MRITLIEFLITTMFQQIKELSEKTNIPQSTISNWSQRKSISALKKATKELDI